MPYFGISGMPHFGILARHPKVITTVWSRHLGMPTSASGQMPNTASDNAEIGVRPNAKSCICECENGIWPDADLIVRECHIWHPAGCHIRYSQMPRSSSRGMPTVPFLNATTGICTMNNSAFENADLGIRPDADRGIWEWRIRHLEDADFIIWDVSFWYLTTLSTPSQTCHTLLCSIAATLNPSRISAAGRRNSLPSMEYMNRAIFDVSQRCLVYVFSIYRAHYLTYNTTALHVSNRKARWSSI